MFCCCISTLSLFASSSLAALSSCHPCLRPTLLSSSVYIAFMFLTFHLFSDSSPSCPLVDFLFFSLFLPLTLTYTTHHTDHTWHPDHRNQFAYILIFFIAGGVWFWFDFVGLSSTLWKQIRIRISNKTICTVFIMSPLSFRQGAVITPAMDHTMSMQPASMMGPLTQQMNHLSLGTTGSVSTPHCATERHAHTKTHTPKHQACLAATIHTREPPSRQTYCAIRASSTWTDAY